MNDQLESARYMLARAKHHVSDFVAHMQAFFDTHPYERTVETDANTNEQVHKVKLVKPMPVMLNGIASDAAHNLRAALDQAGYSVSVASGGKGKDTHFPFAGDLAEIELAKRGRSKEIPNEIFVLMKSFKPYKGGDDLLWSLNQICNANKHRLISPTAVAVNQTIVRGGSFFITGGMSVGGTKWDRRKNEMEVLRMAAGSSFDGQVGISTFVEFCKVKVLAGYPVDAVLNALIGKVDGILMAIEAEARRIGIFK